MRKCSQRNKSKVWVGTYGKKFVARRAFGFVSSASIVAQHASMQSAVAASGVSRIEYAMSVADGLINATNAINEIQAESNKGFAAKINKD